MLFVAEWQFPFSTPSLSLAQSTCTRYPADKWLVVFNLCDSVS